MNKNEKTIAIVFSVIALLLVLPIISAAALTATWNVAGGTGNYSNKSSTFLFNCTTAAAGFRVTNVTVYANTTAGVMNPLESFANTTATQTAWTGTVDIQAADDGSNQNLSCKAQNATITAWSNEKTASRVRLDSTSPVCNISLAHETIAFKQGMVVTYYSSDALARRTTTIDYNGPGKQTTITETTQNGPRELTSSETAYTGKWVVNMTVTDWSGNSCTTSANFTSYLPSGVVAEDEGAAAQADNQTFWLFAIVAVILYLIFKKK